MPNCHLALLRRRAMPAMWHLTWPESESPPSFASKRASLKLQSGGDAILTRREKALNVGRGPRHSYAETKIDLAVIVENVGRLGSTLASVKVASSFNVNTHSLSQGVAFLAG